MSGVRSIGILPKFLFEGFPFFCFRKFLLSEQDLLPTCICVLNLHFIIDLLHEHNLLLAFFCPLFTRLSLRPALGLAVGSSSSLPPGHSINKINLIIALMFKYKKSNSLGYYQGLEMWARGEIKRRLKYLR